MWSYLAGLECTACGEQCSADEVQGTCRSCGSVLFARYDLEALRAHIRPESLAGRAWNMWRYHELLPVRDPHHVVTLGEGATPLVRVRIPHDLRGEGELFVKDEGANPTGSFKARGLAAAISRARELSIPEPALPSAGNAGSAAAAYAAAAGIPVHVAVPADAPVAILHEIRAYAADVTLIDGLIDAAGAFIREQAEERGWFDLSTLREPYRAEGKKTMGFELAEQGGFGDQALPDVIIAPTGGGTGVVGMWKAFGELEQLGWIGARRPRMVVVQAAGCAPLVRAFRRGQTHAEPWVQATTAAAGMRVPSAIGDYLVLDAVRSSNGTAVSVTDEDMEHAQGDLARASGVFTSLEGAATYAAWRALRTSGDLTGDERVVLLGTATGLKEEPRVGVPDAA